MLDMDAFLALTRLSAPVVGPSGELLVTATTTDASGAQFVSAIWRVDPADGSATRLTQPRRGLGLAGVLPDGTVLLRVKRDDPEAPKDDPDADASALWSMPPTGGEPRRVLTAPDGIGQLAIARDAGTVVASIDVFPAATTIDDDRALAKRRKDVGTEAIWFDAYPMRFWDHHLGPRKPRLFVADIATGGLRDLTPDAGDALHGASFALTPDGSRVISTWRSQVAPSTRRTDLVSIDVASGDRTVLATVDGHDHGSVAISPDGRWVACMREAESTPERAARPELWLLPLDVVGDGQRAGRRLAASLDRWPGDPTFTADSSAVVFTADDGGHASAFRVPVVDDGSAPVRLAQSGALSDLQPAPDGSVIHALRSTIGTPPEVVALDPDGVDQVPIVVHAASATQPWPGTPVEVLAVAEDGTELRAWLVLPTATDAPAPLAVFIHGGPLSSWNAWTWRWQPQILAARGYAVLLPDPALSTGYGQAMIERGWQEWGGRPYTDVLALTDAALAAHHLDPERTAVLGGSYGGYLTNWVIGHTDRFRCAVTHASLWDLQQFQGTTDDTSAWTSWWGDPVECAEFYRQWSPSTYLDEITTPTLVIHGERDFRVPVGEGVRLWSDLRRRGVESAFLYLPDENHWVLKPGNARVWYDAVLRWLDHHLGDGSSVETDVRPDLV